MEEEGATGGAKRARTVPTFTDDQEMSFIGFKVELLVILTLPGLILLKTPHFFVYQGKVTRNMLENLAGPCADYRKQRNLKFFFGNLIKSTVRAGRKTIFVKVIDFQN